MANHNINSVEEDFSKINEGPAIETSLGNFPAANNAADDHDHDHKTKNPKKVTGKVPFYKLFYFADHLDYMLMTLGAITAVGSGLCVPFMAIVFGEMINSFGQTPNTQDIVNEVSKVGFPIIDNLSFKIKKKKKTHLINM